MLEIFSSVGDTILCTKRSPPKNNPKIKKLTFCIYPVLICGYEFKLIFFFILQSKTKPAAINSQLQLSDIDSFEVLKL